MGEQLKEVLAVVERGFCSDNAHLNEARERAFIRHTRDTTTARLYDRAIDIECRRDDNKQAALIAVEARQYKKAIEFYTMLEAWEDAGFVAKIACDCKFALDFYKKAGNEYYVQRMQENIDAAKKSA